MTAAGRAAAIGSVRDDSLLRDRAHGLATTTCFVTYEIHPTTWGGCGVLLRHAAEHLLRAGGEVVFLLDIPRHEFDRFVQRDRFVLPHADRVRAYHADTLCEDCMLRQDQAPGVNAWKSVRFAHAIEKVVAAEPRIDFVEFFEYCGVSYYAMSRRLFGRGPIARGVGDRAPVLGTRLHNSLELIDDFGASRFLDRERYQLYALERAGLRLAETILTPTRTYFDRYYRDRYGISSDRVVVSQSPKVDTPRVQRRPDPRGPFTIAYIGRMFAFKGVDQLVRAAVEVFRRRPALNCKVEIMGPDSSESPLGSSYAAYLRSLIPAALRDRFVFTGHLSHPQMTERLNDALFAVFPNRFESFCYALHETYDAGVPVIVNQLPGFADFFHHERNCLTYAGRTDGLVAAMERMLDDGALRERLTRPYAVADDPLGGFYAAPRAARPLSTPAHSAAGTEPQVLAVILAPAGFASAAATIEALRAGDVMPTRTVCLIAAEPDSEETFWWLGRSWHVRDDAGNAISSSDIRTLGAVVILNAGDAPGSHWLASCVTALRRQSSLGFALTWGVEAPETNEAAAATRRVVPSTIDLVPEAYPFEHGAAPTRAVIRTESGLELVDLLDQNLGALGEIGLVWDATARWGAGAAVDEPMITLSKVHVDPVESSLLKYLLARHGGVFADRLKLYSAMLEDRLRVAQAQFRELAAASPDGAPSPPLAPMMEPSLEYRVRMADELGGSLLARMALRKFKRRVTGQGSPRGK